MISEIGPSVGGIHNRILEVTILADNLQSQRELIPKMYLINSDTVPTLLSLQHQSPVCHSCAMVINKAQGQITEPEVGVYVPDPRFAYGQLYMVSSIFKSTCLWTYPSFCNRNCHSTAAPQQHFH